MSSANPSLAAELEPRLSQDAHHLLLPLAYGDLFEFPLTSAEVHRFSARSMTQGRVEELLRGELGQLVFERHGYFGFRGQEELADRRRELAPRLEEAWKAARRRARLIGLTPFVRGVMVTGSLAHQSFGPRADIDYLVLVAPRRLYTVFAVLGTVQRLTSVETLCPNYYLTTDHLELPERDYFVAREILAATPVLDPVSCESFQAENEWAFALFPNASAPPPAQAAAGRRVLARLLETALFRPIGNLVERALGRLLESRIYAHYASCGVEVDPRVVQDARDQIRLRFHARLHREEIRRRLDARLAEVGAPSSAEILDGGP